ncbi:MAG TPA: patatin-like phospholipase family protein, partial [Candidatus Cloacimonadota bacterium]|nr:patatin-like phospholipase family protein [Candidatus Cloacimonadota bacterium]
KWLCLGLALWGSMAFASGIGYAFSGGGARGFAHIGILKVLEEQGLRPDYISGTSIGAIIGALYAMGFSAAEIETISTSADWSILLGNNHSRGNLYIGQKRWPEYGNVVFELNDKWIPQLPSSIYRINNINLELFRLFASASDTDDFARLSVPFRCVSTNLLTGQATVFSEGSLVQALRSSVSIPSLMQPFALEDTLYIDGGIAQNLPITPLREMGADVIIGLKVNSALRTKARLNNLIDVLDQTINIGMTRNLDEHLEDCALLLEPHLPEVSAADFQNVAGIIAMGEAYAREHLDEIQSFIRDYHPQIGKQLQRLEPVNSFRLESIVVHGNTYLSAAKVIEYMGLEVGKRYDTEEIVAACLSAWNSQFFSSLYPVLKPIDASRKRFILHVYVQELERKHLIVNTSYDNEVKLNASMVLVLNNLLLKNSKLLAELKLGGQNELNIDYVKNFGERWGVYYRIFPYINEKTLYAYDEDYARINSVKSLEWGATTGVGLFTRQNIIAEFFLYHSKTSLYRGISETAMPPRNYSVSGIGLKSYHESLDDFTFPSRGIRALVKTNFARDENLSDYVYSSLRAKLEAYIPVHKSFSILTAIDRGTYFNSA